ncbi:MAG: DUF3825 domain-containing protein [Muribaculaceae bacterium]|nr:DUF3825 domain-containing protein [Muribaculaceae bacterium]
MNENSPASITKEQIENIYAHVPTLRGLYVSQETFCNKANELYPSCGLNVSNLPGILDSHYSGVKYLDDFRQTDDADPISVFRLNANKIPRVNRMRQQLRDAVASASVATGEATLEDIAAADPSLSSLLTSLNFGSLLDAVSSQPQFFAVRHGDVAAGEPDVLVKIANPKSHITPDYHADNGDITDAIEHFKSTMTGVIRSWQHNGNEWVPAGKIGVPAVREALGRLGALKMGVALERYLSDTVELGNLIPGDPSSAPMVRFKEGDGTPAVTSQSIVKPAVEIDPEEREKALDALATLLDDILPEPTGYDSDWMMMAQVGRRAISEQLAKIADGLRLREAVMKYLSDRYDVVNVAPEGVPGVWKIRRKPAGAAAEVSAADATAVSATFERRPAPVRKSPDKMTAFEKLMAFAYFHGTKDSPRDGYNLAINKLAHKALPEQWHFGGSKVENYSILKNYLQLTFERLQYEDELGKDEPGRKTKIRVSGNGKYCIFNTGLVDRVYSPVYAFFICNERPGKQKWFFIDFVGSLDANMQNITREFGADLPQPAHYYNSVTDLVYNVEWPIGSFNWPHILDRCERMPEQFLIDNISWLDEVRINGRIDFTALSSRIKTDTLVLNRIKNRIEDAVGMALKRVRWNFKAAIPIYYPDRKQISLLLPLSLDGSGKPDVALVLEAISTGAYIAHTILTLDMAYTNARLITRTDSEWLTASRIFYRRPVGDEQQEGNTYSYRKPLRQADGNTFGYRRPAQYTDSNYIPYRRSYQQNDGNYYPARQSNQQPDENPDYDANNSFF